jgi:phospholipid/cholesterol/gamma-HCH transport system substrate-binding protein
MPRERRSELRVGLLLLAATAVAAVGIFLIGEEGSVFVRKNEYSIHFRTVGGLNAGNPVQLNGVGVGKVKRVILPLDPAESDIRVWIAVDSRYGERVRQDSQARIKTLGLLGDKFVEITSGSPEAPIIPSGGEIPAAPMTSVDELLATGEDTMDNVVAISASLRTILARMERGEGLLGQLTTNTETGERFSESVAATMESVQRVARELETGDGPLARLLRDRELADRLAATVGRLEGLLVQAQEGEGLLPQLLTDAETRRKFTAAVDGLSEASADLARFTEKLESSEGLMQKLLTDEAYAREVTENLRQMVERLNLLSEKLTAGEGTAAKLINDPAIYEAINDIVVGIEESRLLRWLIRNRQKAGIEKRYDDARKAPAEEGPGEAAPAPP